jgi:signal transduction histidine kinase
MRRLPLSFKILLAALLPLLAFATVGIITNYYAHRAHGIARQAHYLASTESEAELGRRLVAVGHATAALLHAEDVTALQAGDEGSRAYKALREKLARVARQSGVRRLYVFTPTGESLGDTAPGVAIGDRYYHLGSEGPLLSRVLAGGAEASMLFTGKDRVPYKTGYAPLRSEAGAVVAVLAVEGSTGSYASLRRLEGQLRSLSGGLWSPVKIGLLIGLALLVLIGSSLLIARSITRPVRRLVEAAGIIGGGDLSRPVEVVSGDEIGVLAASLESMRRDLLRREQELQMMLSGIAHEVRNPLGGMELFAGLLHDEVKDQPEKREMVERIQRELEYLGRVVTEFLDYARQARLEVRPVPLLPLAQEVATLVAGEAEARQVRLVVEATGEPVAAADPEKLRRALLNVLRNAVQATPAGGLVSVLAYEAEGRARLRCRDTGVGMAPDVLDKIFDAFYTTKERGTGLGLALVQKIVESHGGRIDVTSTPGEGTVFTFDLPRADPAADDT